MPQNVIHARNVSKRYKIGALEPYKALRDVVTDAAYAPVRAVRGLAGGRRGTSDEQGAPNELWALDDVSFDVEQGEVVGLIGANGAGKSTLLRVLSRITEPTNGRIELVGRVGSLLEIGTGFHPELTGRENIYLNGSILGMRRAEIERQFDEIVDFSGVEMFLDTPVKRYSSGMQVRLAFAVAAHLQPEILLVDEVLAVGDAQFQAKCLGKMEDVTKEGRTIIFVSHNLAAVRSLCPRSLVIQKGRLVYDGETDGAIAQYLAADGRRDEGVVTGEKLEQALSKRRVYAESPYFTCESISMLDANGTPRTSFRSDEEIAVQVDWECHRLLSDVRFTVVVSDPNGVMLLRTESVDDEAGTAVLPVEPGRYRWSCRLPADLFGEARLQLNVYLVANVMQALDYERVIHFTTTFQGYNGNMRGKALFRPRVPWQIESLERDSQRVPTSRA